MATTQADRLIKIDTPLGKDVLILSGLTGHEGISQLFKFDCDLFTEGKPIDFNKIIGQQVTIRVGLHDEQERFFNGFISRFAQTSSDMGIIRYRAEVVPWLWFLTRTADCRMFQNETVPDIIDQIFKELGFRDYKGLGDLEGSYDPREYCVQYRETDFNFVSRLMEQYGIFYFFEHEEEKHTLVLADSPNFHQPIPGQSKVSWGPKGSGLEEEDVITSLRFEKELRPGKFAHTDFNFKTPLTSLSAQEPSVIDIGGNGKYEIYDFPGEYINKGQGANLAKVRMQEEEAQHYIISGSSTCRAFTTGYKFDIEDYSLIAKDKKTHVLTEVQHECTIGEPDSSGGERTGEERYSNTFTCIPFSVPYRQKQVTPKPIVQGPQTAVVVGRSGEEIDCDEFGRVKVQFHWDREGKKDENSSMWIRVSQLWAGKGWGSMFIPRIGHEVVVEFLEGDPDRPLITGRVYHAENMPPYPLPAEQTKSTIKSNSSKGGGGFNEFRFEDKAGEEEIYLHGQKDWNTEILNNKSQTVGGNESNDVTGSHTESIGKDMTLTVTGNKTESVHTASFENVTYAKALTIGAAYLVNVGAAMNEFVIGAKAEEVGGFRFQKVGGYSNEQVTGKKDISSGKDMTLTTKEDFGLSATGKGTIKIKEAVTHTTKSTFKIEATKNILIESDDSITLKAGKATITLNKDGLIEISGGKINVKGSGAVKIKGSTVDIN